MHPGKLHRLTQGNGILISLVPPRSRFANKKKKRETACPALADEDLTGTADGHLADFSTWRPRAPLGCNFGNLISRLNRGARGRGETRQPERKETRLGEEEENYNRGEG